jgi:hypothetical protein
MANQLSEAVPEASVGRQRGTTTKDLRRVVAAAMVGSVAEWYEFFLYGTASALVFGTHFFKKTGNPVDGLIAAFALYAVGFAARPIGGIVFGYYGDKFGRKYLLQVSLVAVGITTFLMGCLPTFDVIGYWAPALLVTLRLIQGFAFGGEWGGAVLLVSEHSPDDRRGYWASWPQAGVPAGNLVATLILLALSSTLPEQDFLSWGWRVAFWFSAVVVLIGFWIRRKVDDAPIFKESQERREKEHATQQGVRYVLRYHWKEVLIGMARFAENILYLHGGDLAHVPEARGRRGYHAHSQADRQCPALHDHSVHGLPVGHHRSQAGVPDRRGPDGGMGLHWLPDDGHRERLDHHGCHRAGPGNRVDDLLALSALMTEMFRRTSDTPRSRCATRSHR